MNDLSPYFSLFTILMPLFLGFYMPLKKKIQDKIDFIINQLVYIILFFIGVQLSQMGIYEKISALFTNTFLLFTCIILGNLCSLFILDYKLPWKLEKTSKINKNKINLLHYLQQPFLLILGTVSGYSIPLVAKIPQSINHYLLMLLLFFIGISLKQAQISLKQAFLNRRGILIAIFSFIGAYVGGIIFALLKNISIFQGLALASGFGWYSLSGVLISQTIDPFWGSIALLNDLLRELFALSFIPLLMKRFPHSAVSSGGATAIDFTLPILQQTAGPHILPVAISYGLIMNLFPPLFMIGFSLLI